MKAVALVLVSFAVGVACKKVDKPDCDAYVERLVALSPGLSESRIGSVRMVARESCEKGEVSGPEARCAIAATTRDALFACHTSGASGATQPTGSSDHPKPAPSGPRARREGFSVAIPAGWTEDKSMQQMLQLTADKAHSIMVVHTPTSSLGTSGNWVASDDACRAHAEEASKQVGMTITTAKLVVTPLGKNCRMELKDAAHVSITNAVFGSFGALTVACTYDGSDANEAVLAPACSAVLDSVTIE